MMSNSPQQARDLKATFPTPSTVTSDLDQLPELLTLVVGIDLEDEGSEIRQLDDHAGAKISKHDHAFPVSARQPKPEAQPQPAWETAFGVARPRNDLVSAVQSTNSTPTTTWDAAFKVHVPVARFPEIPAAEKPPASIAAAWETASGVARPRNDLMSAVQSANSTPATTWDAAFKVHMPVARFPEMPAA